MKKPIQVFSYQISNSANSKVTIHIDGEIVDASTQAMIEAWFGDTTSTSYKSFRNALDKIEAKEYDVIINSPGGHVGDALAIADLLTDLQEKGSVVNTIGRGIVASSATMILLAGNNPEMSANSFFMMHTVSGGTYGNVDQVENYARTMRTFNNKVRDIYAQKSGLRKEEVTKLMDAETWLTAQDAKEKGFVAKVSGDATFTNCIPVENWDYNNTDILNSYNNSVKTDQPDDMKKLFEDFAATITNLIKGTPVTDKATSQEIVNSIAEKVGEGFKGFGDQMEVAVKEAVTNALKDKATTDQIQASVDLAVQPFKETIDQFEQDQITAKGNASQGSKDEIKNITPIGGFSNSEVAK